MFVYSCQNVTTLGALLYSMPSSHTSEEIDVLFFFFFWIWWQSLKGRSIAPPLQEGNSLPTEYSLESYVHQQPLSPPGSYPIPDTGMHDTIGSAFPFHYRSLSIEEKREYLVVTRNSLELLSSILNSETEPKPLKVFFQVLNRKQ